ncbi:MAG: response regulator [Treponema sp.]|nr:response regulator [Treponema sp.]
MKIILIDPSAVVRAIITDNLKKYPDIEIIASVPNGARALQEANNNSPDAIISDSDAGEINGKNALKVLSLEKHIPLIVLVSQKGGNGDTFKASSIIYMEKPGLSSYKNEFFEELYKNLMKNPQPAAPVSKGKNEYKVLCIGASTGGPTAVSEVLSGLGKDFPLPVLYAQHVEIGSDAALVKWLSDVCHNIKVKLAVNGEAAKPGVVYMAPADVHLEIDYVKSDGLPILRISHEEPERFLRPAVNKLFRSAASKYKNNCLAVLLTGMGQDGADGCVQICANGGWTIVEDKSTCAVFGMPAAAIEAGGAKEVLPRGEIPARILKLVKK